MKYCDLHNHSTFSDGSFTPKELVDYACEKGLSAIALTDHNTVEGIDPFVSACESAGIDYIFGSELTTDYKGNEVHLLCLFITKENIHSVYDFTSAQILRKDESNVVLANKLRESGYNISLDTLKEKYGKNINRAHFAKELVLNGHFNDTAEAFDTVLKSGNGFYFPPKRVGLFEAIKLVRSWGCVPVIAHPLLSVTRNELEELLPVAKECGLVGMEVYYPKFTEEDKNYLHSLCQKYGIIPSGGSDYHGNMKSQGDLNEAKAPYSCYENLYKAWEKIK